MLKIKKGDALLMAGRNRPKGDLNRFSFGTKKTRSGSTSLRIIALGPLFITLIHSPYVYWRANG